MISMRKYDLLLLVGCGFLMAGCSTSRNFGSPAVLHQYRNVAVIGQDPSGCLRRFAGAVTAIENLFRGHLVEKGYGVVDRSILDKTLAELELDRSGLTESASSRFGKIARCDALLLVRVTDAEVVRSRASGFFQNLGNQVLGAARIPSVDVGTMYEARVRLSVSLVDVEKAVVKCMQSAKAKQLVFSPTDIAPAYEHAVDEVAARFPDASTTLADPR